MGRSPLAKHQGFSSLMRTSVSTFKLTHGDLHPNILDRDVVRRAAGRGRDSGDSCVSGKRKCVCKCLYLYMITIPLRLLFQKGPIPKCKIHFSGPPLKCKIGH